MVVARQGPTAALLAVGSLLLLAPVAGSTVRPELEGGAALSSSLQPHGSSNVSEAAYGNAVRAFREVAIVTHHKTGTVAAYGLVMALCCKDHLHDELSHMWTNWWRVPSGGNRSCRTRCLRDGVRYLTHGFDQTHKKRKAPTMGGKVVHFIRHPVDMVISGYSYHLDCSESWTELPLTTDKTAVAYADRSSWKSTLAYRFGDHTNIKRIRDLLGAKPGDAFSYCDLLKENRTGTAAGIEAETLRTLGAVDGVRRMLTDFALLHRPRYYRPHHFVEVCNQDLSPLSEHFEATWYSLVELLKIDAELSEILQREESTYHSHKSRKSEFDPALQAQFAADALRKHGATVPHEWPCASEATNPRSSFWTLGREAVGRSSRR